jgi:sulfur relay (sulfurtransferase) DsrC/TusE family protein
LANNTTIEISKQEAWKMLDALDAYKKDYNVSVAVNKVIGSLVKKLKKVVNQDG